jgi:excisionase family DNA binding protein
MGIYLSSEAEALLEQLEALIDRKLEGFFDKLENDEIIDVNIVCSILGKTRVTIYGWIKDGSIKYMKTGGKYHFSKSYIMGLSNYYKNKNMEVRKPTKYTHMEIEYTKLDKY